MSSNDSHVYRNELTGLLATLTEDAASVFPDVLTLVEDDAKPYLPEMFKPDTARKGRKSAAEKRAEKAAIEAAAEQNSELEANQAKAPESETE